MDQDWMTIAEAAALETLGNLRAVAAVASELAPIIRRMNPKDSA